MDADETEARLKMGQMSSHGTRTHKGNAKKTQIASSKNQKSTGKVVVLQTNAKVCDQRMMTVARSPKLPEPTTKRWLSPRTHKRRLNPQRHRWWQNPPKAQAVAKSRMRKLPEPTTDMMDVKWPTYNIGNADGPPRQVSLNMMVIPKTAFCKPLIEVIVDFA